MQWTDLWIAADHLKVARRLTSAGDLQAFSGRVAIGRAPDELPALAQRDGTWVSTTPMSETVKDVDHSGLVTATVARDQLSIVVYPVIVADVRIAYGATDPDDLLRKILASGEPLGRL